MSDLNDKTLELAEWIANVAVEERLAKARERQCDKPEFYAWDGETCFDCGEDLPEERAKMGRVRCVHCQTRAERLERGL